MTQMAPDFNLASAEAKLDSFNAHERLAALEWLAHNQGDPRPGQKKLMNMHLHSFFSYNALGYSPSHIAWKAFQNGLYAVSLCDFDVLDGLEEFLNAGLLLGLRTAVNLETRAFLKECATVEINSPGEPGIIYVMGAGFAREPKQNSPELTMLSGFRRQAQDRNIHLLKRINAKLPEIQLIYEKDVLPLSPADCATERHIVRAYRLKAAATFKSAGLYLFWSRLMGITPEEVERLAQRIPAMEEKIRAALVKKGGIGYEQPTPRTFPTADDFLQWVRACGAMPMITWLDGTSRGEENGKEMLECLRAKGACALNLIPDRNHNIADHDLRTLKLKKLEAIVHVAEQLELPIIIGTEMNKNGQPFVDNALCPALRPYHAIFMRGAAIIVGQSLLARYADFPYAGPAAESEFGANTKRKNDFFAAAGRLQPLTAANAEKLAAVGPVKALACLSDSAKHGIWQL